MFYCTVQCTVVYFLAIAGWSWTSQLTGVGARSTFVLTWSNTSGHLTSSSMTLSGIQHCHHSGFSIPDLINCCPIGLRRKKLGNWQVSVSLRVQGSICRFLGIRHIKCTQQHSACFQKPQKVLYHSTLLPNHHSWLYKVLLDNIISHDVVRNC